MSEYIDYALNDLDILIRKLHKEKMEKDKEMERLNNIINELEKHLNKKIKKLDTHYDYDRYARMELIDILNKLQKLKGEDNDK